MLLQDEGPACNNTWRRHYYLQQVSKHRQAYLLHDGRNYRKHYTTIKVYTIKYCVQGAPNMNKLASTDTVACNTSILQAAHIRHTRRSEKLHHKVCLTDFKNSFSSKLAIK